MVMMKPTPVQPRLPIACGPRSHSPLPMERPRAIMAGPMIFVIVSLAPVFWTWKTSSGVGRSSTCSGGRPTPSEYSAARTG
jgi:hypothetical protein